MSEQVLTITAIIRMLIKRIYTLVISIADIRNPAVFSNLDLLPHIRAVDRGWKTDFYDTVKIYLGCFP